MSGRKCSDYHLDAERERKSQQLSSISARERQVTAMRQQLAETLARLSPVARRRFATEVAGAEEWPRQIAIDATTPPRLSISSLEADLNSAADHLSGRVASGQTAQRSLGRRVEELDRARMQVDRTLSSLEGRLQARAAILARWHPDQTPVALQSALAAARAQWRDDEFDLAARDLERLDGELSTLIDHAEAREAEATKQQHLRDLFRAQAEVSTCSVRLQSLLAAGSPGLRTTFANEVRAASDWLAQRSGTITAATPATDLAGLASTVAAERQQGSVGHERLDELNRAFGERAAELRATRGAMVSEMEAAWNGGQELLGLWLEPSLVSDLKDSVIRVRQSLDADELLKVEAPATMLLAERQAPTQAATRQESLHQKRMYFLKALRQVCSEMGFQETAPPAFKDRDRRGSPIELAVDTLDRGAVTFFLGLNSIESDSCLSRDVCPEQFEKLADEIRARFGIGFELRPADGSKPDRKRKGELDEPDGGHHSQEK